MSFTTSINIERDFGKTHPTISSLPMLARPSAKLSITLPVAFIRFASSARTALANPASSSPWKTVCVERLLEKMSY